MSVSDDGEWYLVNGWKKYKAFWQQRENCTPYSTFKSVANAMASLTKLLKVMPEYRDDKFSVVKISVGIPIVAIIYFLNEFCNSRIVFKDV